MLSFARHMAALLAFALMYGCGGGGGGTAVVASTETFNLSQAWVNYLTSTQSLPFTVQGNISGVSVTGSGTYSQAALQAATFETQPALLKSSTATFRLSANGQTVELAVVGALYVNSSYVPLGSENAEEYSVVTSAVTIPATARVGDNGNWYTETRYPSSAKLYSTGTQVTAFALEADTASTALLKILNTEFDSSNNQISQTIITFRMTPAGGLTRLSESTVVPEGTLRVRY